jgi:hypothetical protein
VTPFFGAAPREQVTGLEIEIDKNATHRHRMATRASGRSDTLDGDDRRSADGYLLSCTDSKLFPGLESTDQWGHGHERLEVVEHL